MQLMRYDDSNPIKSKLDPLQDCLNLLSSLKSLGFTSDLLNEKHDFSNAKEIRATAKLIGLHTQYAISLADQAFSGPFETSYLPLYYSTLNFNKVQILLFNLRLQLASNKLHGAKYEPIHSSKNFFNQEIIVKPSGTIPLLYKAVTNRSIVTNKNGLKIKMGEIYPYINSIGAELHAITKVKTKMLCHSALLVRDDKNGHFLKIEIRELEHRNNPPSPKMLKAYPGIRLNTTSSSIPYYESKRILGNFESAKSKLRKNVKRYLITDEVYKDGWISYTPINGKDHVFSVEQCISLAYFQLSNIVRYNPEHLSKLMDSHYWPILIALRNHGFYLYVKLMWGNYNKYNFDIA